MADVGLSMSADTSSYPKPGTGSSALDMVSKLGALKQQQQQIESGGLSIDKQKLDLVNQRFAAFSKQLIPLLDKPDLTRNDIINEFQKSVKLGLMPQDAAETAISTIPNTDNPTALKLHLNSELTRGQSMVDAINYHLGQRQDVGNGQSITPTVTSVKPGFGVRPIAAPIQQQAPPTTEAVDTSGNSQTNPNYGQRQLLGAQPAQVPPGMAQVPGGVPGQYQPASGLPVARPSVGTPNPTMTVNPNNPRLTGPNANILPVENPQTFNDRFDAIKPRGVATAAPLGVEQQTQAGVEQLKQDQALAAERATAVKPMEQALKLLPGMRSGPGTDAWNKGVAFLKANGIIDTTAENDPTVLYQEVNKKLQQYVATSGLSGRSDAGQALAAASSPNLQHQLNPALINLARDAIALDRVQIARAATYTGNPKDYGNYRANFPQSIDERAFKLDHMPEEARHKLIDSMHELLYKNGRDKQGNPINPPAAAKKFFDSIKIAKQQGYTNFDSGGE